ncbi:hypothetical protein [uncultured Thermosynechococcus sp.]|uniref:hypothetical protein n=1 Tax=uncultured Thermosynechococcus sp. TaxID=436945 RepID=UPI002613BA02|nr:hypothetical protein [uncultured Thermosynechococcus sp.]
MDAKRHERSIHNDLMLVYYPDIGMDEDDDYRQQLSQKLQQMDLDRLLFHSSEKKFFRQAIDYLIANHDVLR